MRVPLSLACGDDDRTAALARGAFRHNGIYVSPASGISAPADLAGRVVGVAEYQLTANVWIRGILGAADVRALRLGAGADQDEAGSCRAVRSRDA